MKKTLAFIAIIITVGTPTFSQLQDYNGLGIFLRQTFNKGSTAPGAQGVNYFGFGMDVVKSNFEQKKLQFSLRNRVIGDFVSLIVPGNIRRIAEQGPEITTGLLGWWNFGYTVYQNGNLNVAPALALHDYIYTSGKIEPNGYYFSIGPGVMVDYLIPSTEIMAHFEASYAVSGRATAQDEELGENYDKDSENPHFVNLQLELRYKKLFLGLSPVWIINRYAPTQNIKRGYRFDIMLGFRV